MFVFTLKGDNVMSKRYIKLNQFQEISKVELAKVYGGTKVIWKRVLRGLGVRVK